MPRFLPNGKAVLFYIWNNSPDASQVAVYDFDTGQQRILLSGTSPQFATSGHLVFFREGSLWAVPFAPDRLEVTGEPRPVVEGVEVNALGWANYSLAHDDTLVYRRGFGGGLNRTLVWVDRQGREEPLALDPGGYSWARVSPDGTRVALDVAGPEGRDVWTSDVARGTLSILTPDPAADGRPLWTLDGERVVFRSNREGSSGLFWKAADGRGAVELLLTVEDAQQLTAYDWSPDGNELIFDYQAPDGDRDIGVLSMEGGRPWQPLLNSVADESHAALSPDGRWIAYISDETGQDEVYVERFPDLGNKEQISTGGGRDPVWSPDGSELFYSGGSRMMVVPIDTEPTLTLGTATVVFEGTYIQVGPQRRYDLAPDGRFLMIKPGGATTENAASAPDQIVLVQHWFEELTRLVPTP